MAKFITGLSVGGLIALLLFCVPTLGDVIDIKVQVDKVFHQDCRDVETPSLFQPVFCKVLGEGF
jgi:hypothetical protein